ncbi:hypothetical protein HDV00_000736 [Rhizophlyctis rosea]|nr:hypothetical protein HDV00_000736 [Rhizophlyctis rosea]
MGKKFPTFVPPTLAVPEEVLEKVVDECNSKLANYGEVFGNETERREFISSILHRINFAYSNKVLMRREYTIKSKIAGGPVEYVFIRAESSDPAFVTAVTEAKGKDMRGGRAQCLMQLEVAHHLNQQHAGAFLNHVYGMVTDGMHWHFLRFGGPSDIAWSKEYSCFPATDAVSVEHIRTTASVINGILNAQAEQL